MKDSASAQEDITICGETKKKFPGKVSTMSDDIEGHYVDVAEAVTDGTTNLSRVDVKVSSSSISILSFQCDEKHKYLFSSSLMTSRKCTHFMPHNECKFNMSRKGNVIKEKNTIH